MAEWQPVNAEWLARMEAENARLRGAAEYSLDKIESGCPDDAEESLRAALYDQGGEDA